MKRNFKTLISAAVILCFVILAVASGSGDNTPVSKVGSEGKDNDNIARVGETLERGGIQITLDKVELYTDDSEYFSQEPEEGNVYLLLWFTVKNTTEKDEYINSLYGSGYCDDLSAKEVWLMNVKGETFGGDIAAGKNMKGYIAYEVPENWNAIEYQYKTLFATQESKMTFKATKDDIK